MLPSERRFPSPSAFFRAIWLPALLLAVLLLVLTAAQCRSVGVRGSSMEPGLLAGDRLIVSDFFYRGADLDPFGWLPWLERLSILPAHAPSRGDVIVFRSGTQGELVKRVIGVPGDLITIDSMNGRVFVDKEPLEEPYVRGMTACGGICQWSVPPASYFVLGDNREKSADSRQGWFVPEEDIIGRVLAVYWRDGRPDLGR